MSPNLRVRRLNAHYRRYHVLHDVDLPDFHAGELIALVGPNGAGKSTLLRALAGLLDASGDVHLDTLDLLTCSRRERARHLGFMPQALPEGIALTVLETLLGALHAGSGGLGREGIEQAHGVLSQLGIAGLAMRPLEQLSGGQRQMVSLAQAVIRDPRLLLLDEPTSALDLRHQHRVMSLVRSLADDGRIVVAVLHDLGLAARWADQLVVLEGGRIHAAGAADRTLTPEMLAEVYRIEARVERCSLGRLHVTVDDLAP